MITQGLLDELASVAETEGVMRLSAVRLDHPGFAAAGVSLDRFLDEGRAGEMEFLERSRVARKDPATMLPGARTLLVGLVPYGGEPGPIARYAQSADYHTVLHERLAPVADLLRAKLPDVEAMICVDTRPVMERAAAVLAGLGFLGKNGMVITPGLGSYTLLGSVLTTATLSAPDAVVALDGIRWDACGSCTRCLDACPTQAFPAPGELDPRRCISYLTIEHRGPIAPPLADAMGERVAGCDVCQEVCPYNASPSRDARVPSGAWLPAPPGPARTSDLATISTLRSSRHRAFVKGTALRRIPRRSLRRNALVAIGNGRAALSSEERAAVDAGVRDDDPQVSEAARRAAKRRG